MTARTVSGRHEPCGACGDPLIVCPGTVSSTIRCCRSCTHWSKRDNDIAERADP